MKPVHSLNNSKYASDIVHGCRRLVRLVFYIKKRRSSIRVDDAAHPTWITILHWLRYALWDTGGWCTETTTSVKPKRCLIFHKLVYNTVGVTRLDHRAVPPQLWQLGLRQVMFLYEIAEQCW